MSDFKILTDIEHALRRPAVWIGSVSSEPKNGFIDFSYTSKVCVPGLLKIIEEILDNAVDEAIRTNFTHANQISLSIEEDLDGWKVSVKDNGRGIPVVKHGDKYQAELCWTVSKAGTNFKDDGRTTIGANGVGSFLTAVYSTKFVGTSCDGKQAVVVTCLDNLTSSSSKLKNYSQQGTTVDFWPDLSRFGLTEITEDHIDVLRDRVQNLAICYDKISFKFNGKKIECPKKVQLAKKFHEDAVAVEGKDYVFVIAPSGEDQEFRFLTYVNGLHIKNGGSHIDHVMGSLCSELQPMIKRKWKIEVTPASIKQHLTLGMWVKNFPNPKFDSQTKERLTNTNAEVKTVLDFDVQSLAKKIISTESIINPIVQALLYKKELADRLAAARALKKATKKKIANHLPAQDKDWTKRRLFLTEGLSAVGSLISVRDSNRDGAYALRGKVMNTHGMTSSDFMKNKELSELVAILGLDIGSQEYEDLNYGEICIMTDADPDGAAISCLLVQFFSKWPKLFQEGRVKRVESPVYIARKGKKVVSFYTKAEYNDAISTKLIDSTYEISYIKGLGSLETEDYKEVLQNTRTVTMGWEGHEKLDMAFGNDADARKSWMMN